MRVVATAALSSVALFVAVTSCREPTAIHLRLSTDIDCSAVAKQSVVIRVGSRAAVRDGTAQTTVASTCDKDEIGTLTIVPSGDDAPVVITATLGTGATPSASCSSGMKDCVVASRSLSYVRHTVLELPVRLTKSCVGVPCASDETCAAGRCVGDEVRSCPNDVCDEDSLPRADGGIDAATPDVSVDAPPIVDASVPPDGSTNCGGTFVNLATNAAHCGACNFDCTGGSCQGGVCKLANVTGQPGAEIAIDSTRVVWTGGADPVRSVPKNGASIVTVVLTPAISAYGVDYYAAAAAFVIGVNGAGVNFQGWSGGNPSSLASANKGACAELLADGTSLLWFDPTAMSARKDGSTYLVSAVTTQHVAATATYHLAYDGTKVTRYDKVSSTALGTTTQSGCTWIVGDPKTDAVYLSCATSIKKIASIANGTFADLQNTTQPSRMYFDASKKRLVWVSAGNSIVEATENGTGTTTDLDASQGVSGIGDLVADGPAVYFLANGVPHKVARK